MDAVRICLLFKFRVKKPQPQTKALWEDITSLPGTLHFQLRWTTADWLVISLLGSYQPRVKKLQVTCPWDKFCTMSFQRPHPLVFQNKTSVAAGQATLSSAREVGQT